MFGSSNTRSHSSHHIVSFFLLILGKQFISELIEYRNPTIYSRSCHIRLSSIAAILLMKQILNVSQVVSENNDSENNQTWETRPQIFWRESEEDHPPSQEYLGEFGFKVLDLER
jgi:hypothetical protein